MFYNLDLQMNKKMLNQQLHPSLRVRKAAETNEGHSLLDILLVFIFHKYF